MAGLRVPIGRVLVRGPSMLPVLDDGDCLLVRRTSRVRAGDLVVARLRALPDVLVVKRAVEPRDGGWYVTSDNPAVRGFGVTEGVADVAGRVVLRYWPLPPWRPSRSDA